ncbi:MAG: DNA-directed RNA polymerase subunit beta', partial [Planctomycetota bacterium]|nr:DNA-directed RNA polymerase subunit beta' [Planctomycetota bacterium]
DGQLPPNDILKIQGEEHVQAYMVEQIQSVYRAQGVSIDDKHVEIIVAQMMRKVVVTEAGDSQLLPNSLIDRKRFNAIRTELAKDEEKALPQCRPEIMGITKASVQSDSFISAASFQETTKVLTEAALRGKQDTLLGLKENVILGNLIPAGTGFRGLLRTHVERKHDFSQFEDELDATASFEAALAAEGVELSEGTEEGN